MIKMSAKVMTTKTHSSAPTNTFHLLWSKVLHTCLWLWLHCSLIVSNQTDPDTKARMITVGIKPVL